jgi:hypothetical protein
MKTGPLSLFKRALRKAPPVHPVDRQLAKRWIKTRLLALYPELRQSPEALEAAYQALDLQPHYGTRAGDAHTYYEVTLPES